MKTLNELKKVFIGIWISAMMISPIVYLTDGYSIAELFEHLIKYPEEILMEIAIGFICMIGTYLIYTLYKAVASDVKEIIAYFKKKKETNK